MKFKNARKDLNLRANDSLYKNSKSPFAPKLYKDLNPKGFKIFTFKSGFKKKNDDLLIIVFDEIINVACKYSLTSTPSAPIIWDKKNNAKRSANYFSQKIKHLLMLPDLFGQQIHLLKPQFTILKFLIKILKFMDLQMDQK